MKKIIITGATGFIGTRLIERLACHNYKIFAVIREESTKKILLPKKKNIEIIEINMDKYNNIKNVINEECDILYHLSWNGVRGNDRNDLEKQNLNLKNSIDLVKSCIDMNCKKIIIAGSQAEYGQTKGIITEDTVCKPVNNYGIKKLEFYKEALKISSRNNVSLIEARFFSVYGPNDYNKSLVSQSISNMLQNKECSFTECIQKWNYLYIDDAVDALIKLGEEQCPMGIYNVASYETKELRKFIYLIRDILKSKSELNFGKVKYNNNFVTMEPNIDKIISKTSWRPKITFEEGIHKIISECYTTY